MKWKATYIDSDNFSDKEWRWLLIIPGMFSRLAIHIQLQTILNN